jgi:hypothetical protein
MKACRNGRKTCVESVRIHACLAGHVEGCLDIETVGCRVQEEHMNMMGNGLLRRRIGMARPVAEAEYSFRSRDHDWPISRERSP